jgi:hypothetical protein
MRDKARPAEIILTPDLSRCIETTAREEFGRSMRLLLGGEEQPGLAERTDLLRLFLETGRRIGPACGSSWDHCRMQRPCSR